MKAVFKKTGRRITGWCIKHRLVFPLPRFWLLIISLLFLIWFAFSLPSKLFTSGYSTILEDEKGTLLAAHIAPDHQWRFPISDTVPYRFRECIRMFEDEYFFRHPGINPVSLFRATTQNIKNRKIISGGSTISMQLIRLSKNNQQRNILVKLYEMVLALRLELRYSKDEILRMYVSHAPFGGNVVGLEAAAWRYYGRPASQLSWGESASLAVLPNAPAIIFPGRNQEQFVKKRNRLLSKLYKKGIIDEITCQLAQEEPVPGTPYPLPRLAPHLLQHLILQGYQGQKLRTTLQRPMQQFAVQTAQQYIRIYAGNYIHNMAIVVMDTQSGDILAWVGNTEFQGIDNAAFVDHVTASRSSGSILKPFLYAAMLQEGSLLPNALVADIPTRYGSYRPENFEKNFMGAVPADVALARSLNIPAVRQLHEYSVEKFREILLNCGFTTINRSADHYGLSLILGGAEVNLLETTAAYAGIGRKVLYFRDDRENRTENFNHFSIIRDKQNNKKVQPVLNLGALWFTLEALTQVNRPSLEMGWEHFASTRKIAWKTGTSIGSRDAWSVGVTPDYTVGVWVGNASGEGRPGLTGVTHAAPVMFEIFKCIGSNRWFDRPTQDMEKIDICVQSGFRAGQHCDKEARWVPVNGQKADQCPYHRSVMLDATRSWRVNSSCFPVSLMQEQSWFVLPPSMEYYYRQHHPGYHLLPPVMPDCESPVENVMDILVPDNNTAVYVPSGSDNEPGMVVFEAVHRNPATTLFWHMNGEYLGSTRGTHKLELSLTAGKHLLLIQDEAGNVVRRRFEVK